jgi:hypothetical protein
LLDVRSAFDVKGTPNFAYMPELLEKKSKLKEEENTVNINFTVSRLSI